MAWICMVPFLSYLKITHGWKSRFIFSIVLFVTWSLIILKVISPPIPFYFIPMYSLPIALFHFPGYYLYGKFRNHKWSVLLFPSFMIILEWIQYTYTSLASWGVVAYTQVDSIRVAQSLSVFGMGGLSFLIYWINSSITELIINKKVKVTNLYMPLGFLIFLLFHGHLRLELIKDKEVKTITVATIGTDSQVYGLPLPSKESNQKVIHNIFEKTAQAGIMGAKLAVWTEAAFYVTPETEIKWQDSIAQLSKKNNISIVASYVVPVSKSPFRFENKYFYFTSNGKLLKEYLKHESVPGEPAIKGESPLSTVDEFDCNIGGAICYDYDFPYLARLNQKAKADLVALPSSDWRGIDPLHTQMAAFRAIKQGYSIVRSTRFGLSAAINPYGKMVNQMSSFDNNSKIMISNIQAAHINTIYSKVGDLIVYISILFVGIIFVCSFFSR